LHSLYTDSKAKGGMRRAEENVITLDRTNFEQEFKPTADRFKDVIMKRLQDRKLEIINELNPEADRIFISLSLTSSQIEDELKRLKRAGGVLTPDEETALKKRFSFDKALEHSTTDIKTDWQLIQDNSYPIGEIEVEPVRITKIKEESEKFKKNITPD
jgi:hypothetical protein